MSVDPFSGRQETTVGAFGANVQDVALHPNGSLYAYSIPNAGAQDDASTGHLFRIDPSLTTPPRWARTWATMASRPTCKIR